MLKTAPTRALLYGECTNLTFLFELWVSPLPGDRYETGCENSDGPGQPGLSGIADETAEGFEYLVKTISHFFKSIFKTIFIITKIPKIHYFIRS